MWQVSQSTSPAERLLNLVIALVNTGHRMTREQIRASVVGYGDAVADSAFERMFERDKDLLRELGVPVVTIEGAHASETGYRIDMDAYALPPIELTPTQFAVLGVAAELWQDHMLQVDTARALTKLRAAAAGPAGPQDDDEHDDGAGHEDGTGHGDGAGHVSADDGHAVDHDADAGRVAAIAPRVREAGSAYGPLLDAIIARRCVRFGYRAASSGELTTRTLEPWRIVARRGGWYVLGHDRDKGAPRAFRLSRITGNVRATGASGAFDVPAQLDVDALLGVHRVAEPALLAVVPERAAALRAHARVLGEDEVAALGAVAQLPEALAGRDVLTAPIEDLGAFAGEIAGYADAVVVLGPPELRRVVIDRLRSAARLEDEERHDG